MVDYIIVGCGLAGISFAETALKKSKRVFVYSNASQNSSIVAAGLYNPVILKRFSALKDAEEQIELLTSFYSSIENKLKIKINYKLPILRKFFSIEEQNNWFLASDKPGMAPFLSTSIVKEKYDGIDSPFDFGEVLHTGYVDSATLLDRYKNYLIQEQSFSEETFEYDALQFHENHLQYKGITAKHIVFAEGFGIHSNPFFNHLPLDGTKGELFIVKAPDLRLDAIVNTNVFILPLGNDLFKIGATYNWDDKTPYPTQEGKQELIDRIKEIVNCDFEIIEHLAGIRPTVKDRRPLLGTHPDHKNMHLLNGLGTRGVMLGPYMANILFNHIEDGTILDREIDIKRYYPKN